MLGAISGDELTPLLGQIYGKNKYAI